MQLMPHTKGKWAAKKERLVLQPWQCFIECNLFGWVHKQTGKRRFRECYEEEPRKNGKSLRLAARGIYLFCADDEAGAEIYSGATTEKQAYEVFRPAWQMVQKLPALRSRYGIELAGNSKNPGPMYVTDDMSKFETMIGKPGDGSSPHAALVDEYHEHETDHMVDAMQTGMGAREQPLLSIITTAGTNLAGPCYQKRRDVIRILEGQAEDDTVFGIIFGLDEEDRWDDPANLKKANPNYGISVFEDFLLSQLAQAKRSASKQNAFRTKHLNQWVGARTVWMNTLAWQRQQNRDLELEAFSGERCWVGVDLASKRDIAAVVMLIEQRGEYSVIPRFYVPESALEENDRYREYSTEGAIIVTPGNMTDYEFIETDIQKIAATVDVQKIGFDEWQANYLITRLQSSGFENRVVVYNQTVRNMSEPMKEVEARIMARTLWHDGNSCMNWMMGNVSAKVDAKENVYPRKDVATEKIDGVVALIMAMGMAMGEVTEYASGRLVAI
jgi:phage terminase large subunit-like protein